ncbi:maltokinase [Streptomyces sp. B5E4]|uniref:maltokinase n=1 Tax=Streptomyces sp. B5E4 TaxID=3153568 RepID=UPI00325CAC9C
MSATALLPGVLHLLVRVRQPGAGSGDCYQLLLGTRRPPAAYDALADPRTAALLLERLRRPGRTGRLTFVREGWAGGYAGTGLPARPLAAEQSHTSVVYGDRFVLKVFRRVDPGPSPDLEVPSALARAGGDRVPPPLAWFETSALTDERGSPATLGVLSPYLADAADGRRLAAEALAARTDFTPYARALGRATADLHETLRRALPVTVLRAPQSAALAAAMTARLAAAAAAVPALRPYRARLGETFAAVAELGAAGRTWRAQRVHGDLHLGQTLRGSRSGRWSFVDFEGEPELPPPARRRPHPVTRDVAGMLRSFTYAAPGAPSWADRCGAAYCAGYAERSGTDPREEAALLRAYVADRAVHEVVYEAGNRPGWLGVPLGTIADLAG